MVLQKTIEALRKLGLKQDQISRTIYEKTKNGWVSLSLVDLWIELYETTGISFPELQLLLSSERTLPKFNAAKEWLESLKPADEKIFNTLCNFLDIKRKNSTDQHRLKNSLKKWFVSAVRTIYEEDFVPKYCFVLIGPEGIGKTPFLRGFLPKPMQYLISIDPASHDLRHLTDRIIIFLESIGHWLKCKGVAQKYRTLTSIEAFDGRPRMASFLGASADAEFLKEHPSDRFVIFEIEKIWNKRAEKEYQLTRKENLGKRRTIFPEDFDMGQVWAAALKMYREGYSSEYSAKELEELRRHQKLATRKSSKLELFYEYFLPAIPNDPKSHFLSADEICKYLNRYQKDHYFVPVPLGRELKRDGIKRAASMGKKGYYLHYKMSDREDLREKRDENIE